MKKSVEINDNTVTNIATGEVYGWVIVDESVAVNIGDTATETDGEWSFTTPTPTLSKQEQSRQKKIDATDKVSTELIARVLHAVATGATPTSSDVKKLKSANSEFKESERLEREWKSEQSAE